MEGKNDDSRNLQSCMKEELLKTCKDFITEVELSFDYIDKDMLARLESFLVGLQSQDTFDKFVAGTVDELKPYEADLYKVILGDRKLKSHDFDFMNKIRLFEGIVCFQVFSSENKNTKKSLVQYAYNIYMGCSLLSIQDLSLDTLTNELNTFAQTVEKQAQLRATEASSSSSNNKVKRHVRQRHNNMTLPAGAGGLEHIFQGLMSNPDILNIATDITHDLENQNINPMTLLTSLMSGTPNGQIDSIVQSITNKLEEKISSGEIDKDALERQASQLVNSVSSSDIAAQLPMLKSMMKEQFKKK